MEQISSFVPIFMMAMALGMDALSLGVGIGIRGIRLLDVAKVSLLIGLFHLIMPLLGIFTGRYASQLLGDVTLYVGGGLLVLLGLHMIFSAFRDEDATFIDHRTVLGMIIFAFTVSIDSFSVGISLGLFTIDLWLTVCTFAAMGMLLSLVGLLLGRRVGFIVGDYGEALGGVILLAFGVKFLL